MPRTTGGPRALASRDLAIISSARRHNTNEYAKIRTTNADYPGVQTSAGTILAFGLPRWSNWNAISGGKITSAPAWRVRQGGVIVDSLGFTWTTDNTRMAVTFQMDDSLGNNESYTQTISGYQSFFENAGKWVMPVICWSDGKKYVKIPDPRNDGFLRDILRSTRSPEMKLPRLALPSEDFTPLPYWYQGVYDPLGSLENQRVDIGEWARYNVHLSNAEIRSIYDNGIDHSDERIIESYRQGPSLDFDNPPDLSFGIESTDAPIVAADYPSKKLTSRAVTNSRSLVP